MSTKDTSSDKFTITRTVLREISWASLFAQLFWLLHEAIEVLTQSILGDNQRCGLADYVEEVEFLGHSAKGAWVKNRLFMDFRGKRFTLEARSYLSPNSL